MSVTVQVAGESIRHQIFELMAEEGFPLDSRLKESYFSYRYMALEWRATDPDVDLVGEFKVMSIDSSSDERLEVDDFAWHDSDRELLSQLSVLDDMSPGRLRATGYDEVPPGCG